MKKLLLFSLILIIGCVNQTVPHEGAWGVYSLDLISGDLKLIYSNNTELSGLRLSPLRDKLAFAMRVGGGTDAHTEICVINFDGSGFRLVTNNTVWDTYPAWSPNGEQLVFLSFNETFDLHVINLDGSNESVLYASEFHDADVDWVGDKLAFTRESSIWLINSDGSNPKQVTNFSRKGEWGQANLPFGDYDPRLSPDGTRIVFERLINDSSIHGNYEIFLINIDGSSEVRLTNTSYSQGFATWSPSGERIAFLVAAINNEGHYRLYEMNADGSNVNQVTPSNLPSNFLCHAPVYYNETVLLFTGQWFS